MICNLCHKDIDTKNERYVHIEDYDCEERKTDMWCHLNCYNQSTNKDEVNGMLKKFLFDAGKTLNNIKKQIPGGEDEVIELC